MNGETSPLVIALGGNAITPPNLEGTIPQQFSSTRETCEHIVTLIERGHNIILTHGNGPQVGNVLRRVERARDEVYPLPLDVCVADTEGGMGYMIQQCMENALRKRKIKKSIITVITQIVVDRSDSAFQKPTKPIGPFMGIEDAKERRKKNGWQVVEDAGRGYRRVVPSPRPIRIVEINAIRALIGQDCIVIACGGGGIPVVVDESGNINGVEGVIDKDWATALLACEIGARTLIISTGTEKVALNYRKPDQVLLDELHIPDARSYLAQGQFPPGSMGPKIAAAIYFLENAGRVGVGDAASAGVPDAGRISRSAAPSAGVPDAGRISRSAAPSAGVPDAGRQVVITTPDRLADALDGKTGTRILA